MVLGIYGAGGLGREAYILASQINVQQKRWEEFIFIVDNPVFNECNGIRVHSFSEVIEKYKSQDLEICIAIGEPQIRAFLRQRIIDSGFSLATLIHPNIYVPEDTIISKGSIISENCFISCGSCIGENVYLQPGAMVGHDSQVGSDSVISSLVMIGGKCRVGNRTYIGPVVPVKDQVNIGDDSIIALGSAVIRDIPNNVIALGNPARPMKNNDDKKVFKNYGGINKNDESGKIQ
jgi:sugar O-acyltransferase (sialic acid O-acetyltransferase NeuD family)